MEFFLIIFKFFIGQICAWYVFGIKILIEFRLKFKVQ